MLIDLVFILLGLGGLFLGGEWLIRSSSRLATGLGIPALVVGLTVVAVGTSMPELVVSVSAALGGSSDIALGNVLGSNIANIALILGLAGAVAPITIHISIIRREFPVLISASLAMVACAVDGIISQVEGLLLFFSYFVFTFLVYRTSSSEGRSGTITAEVRAIEGDSKRIAIVRELGMVAISLIVLIIGAQLTVNGAVNIARAVGMSELIIGLTLVAVGTSLPEVATSVVASMRRHSDLAIGNVIGSNISNILVILGFTAIITPINVDPTLLRFEFPIMLVTLLVLVILVWNRTLTRREGLMLVVGYIIFILVAFIGRPLIS